MAKKAGTESVAVKPKIKAPAKKRKNEAAVENGVSNTGSKSAVEEGPAKRTRRRKVTEESAAPATVQPTRESRKRKNAQNTKETIVEAGNTQVVKEAEDETEAEATVPNKKSRGKAKKTETNDAPKVVSKGRPKKKPAKVVVAKLSLEEAEIEEQNKQNMIIQENNSKAKNMKNAKTRNAKKASPKGKHNTAEKISNIQLEETILEADIKESGDTDTAQMAESKQKKKNTGKTNVATDKKTESKGRQKKGQVATVSEDEVEGTKHAIIKKEITEKENPISETLNGNDVFSSKNDSMSSVKETNEINKSKELTKSTEMLAIESTDNKLERSASFIPFGKKENY